MPMKATGRLYNCARCHAQAIICRPCDRGHIYCSPRCSQQARKTFRKRAQQRYQKSPKGRQVAAARQSRFRAKRRRLVSLSEVPATNADIKKVTHQCSAPSSQSVSLPSPPKINWWRSKFRDAKCRRPSNAQGRCYRCGIWVKNFRLRL